MRFLYLLHKHMGGVRLYALFLVIMLFFAMVSCCVAVGEVQYAAADLNVIKDAKGKNAYLLTYFPKASDITTGLDSKRAEKLQVQLETHENVKDTFGIRVANTASYEGEEFSVILYEPGMLSFFPKLKELGFDFSMNPDGCILAGSQFDTLRKETAVTLRFGKEQVTLPVLNRLDQPYRHLSFGVSSTNLAAQDLFTDGAAVFMQSTDSVMEMLENKARRISCSSNLIVVFDASVEEQAVQQMITEMAPEYTMLSFDKIIADSEQLLRKEMVESVPIPAFLTITSFYSFFSIAVLTVKKKQKELAYVFLCGGSRRSCRWLSLGVCQVYALIPLLLTSLVVWLWPIIPWVSIRMELLYAEEINYTLLSLVRLFMSFRLDHHGLWVASMYYLFVVCLSVAVTHFSMKRHTPLTFLRGVS